MFTFTISTAHAKELLHSWAYLTPEEEEAVLALEGPDRTEMVHRRMAQNDKPGTWVLDLKNHYFGPTDPKSQRLIRLQSIWGKEADSECLTWWATEGEKVHEGSERARKRIDEMGEANLKARPEFRSLRAKLNRTRQQAKVAKQACKACQKAEEELYRLKTEVDDWSFPATGPEALEASRLYRQMNFCTCQKPFETKIEKLKDAIMQLEIEERRKIHETAKDQYGLWLPEFTEPEPAEELDWGL